MCAILRSEAFRVLLKDPSGKLERTMIKLIKATGWSEGVQAIVKPNASVSSRRYGLSKVQKKWMPCVPHCKYGWCTYLPDC